LKADSRSAGQEVPCYWGGLFRSRELANEHCWATWIMPTFSHLI